MAQPPRPWFLNTPVLWATALVLFGALRGPLRSAPAALKKTLAFLTTFCLAIGLAILLTSQSALRLSRNDPVSGITWFVLMGVSTGGLLISFFYIFLRRPRRIGMAPVPVIPIFSRYGNRREMSRQKCLLTSAEWITQRIRFGK